MKAEAPEVETATTGRRRKGQLIKDGRNVEERTRFDLERGEQVEVYVPPSDDPKASRVVVLARINGATWMAERGSTTAVPLEVARIAHAAKITAGAPPKGAFSRPVPSGPVHPLTINEFDPSRQSGRNPAVLVG